MTGSGPLRAPAPVTPATEARRSRPSAPPRVSKPDTALHSVGPGAVVAASPYCATPTTLLAALARRSRDLPDLVLCAGLLLGDAPYFDAVLTRHLTFRTWHVSETGRRLAAADALDYIPIRAGDVAAYLRSRVDVAVARVTPPDAHGVCSLGPSASYTKAMLAGAAVRLAEIDPELPWTYGADVTYPYAEFDHVVDAETPTSTYTSNAESAQLAAIASHVIRLLRDGVTLQLGIGGVSEAIAHALSRSDVGDLRVVGMVTDAVVDMAEQDRLATQSDAIQAVELLGSRRVFEFAHRNPAVEMFSSSTIHDVAWLATQPRLVSVCSALSVDLSGQVASEQIGGRLVAGVGGSADFFEGAHLSRGGIRVVALPATTPAGASRLRVEFAAGTPVTLPRHSVDYVVTEYGAAHLAGRSVRERAEALAAVAAPEHRQSLLAEWSTVSRPKERT